MKKMLKSCLALVAACLLLASSTPKAQSADIVDTAVQAGAFKTLAAALDAAGLVETLKGEGPFTVFAPTDEAFAKLPEGVVESLLKPENKEKLVAVLTYHVAKGATPAAKVVKLSGVATINGQQADVAVQGDQVRIDKATVVKADIQCDNGVIHVIDQVILPAMEPIPAVAEQAGKFNTLLAAVKAAGLAETLSGKGPFTVLAPTDEAFAALPEGTVETLLKPENKQQLVDILKYHVISGRVYSQEALKAGAAKTLQGAKVSFDKQGKEATVNGATLVATDVDASNGVIHVIDAVIVPPGTQSSSQPQKMIEQAIATGAPLYNAGHHSACAQVYMTTARELLSLQGHGMSTHTAHALQTALDRSSHTSCANTQAWTMRRALELAYSDVR